MELDRVREIANELLKAKKIFWKDWRFDFDNATSYYGTYNHRQKKIFASRYRMTEAAEPLVREVILHLIAHAIAGYQVTTHGDEWKKIALDIGAHERASVGGVPICKIKQPDRKLADSPVARQFSKIFSPSAVIEMSELPQLTNFRFSDYTSEMPTGKIVAFLECKLWQELGGGRLMKLYFQTETKRRICIEAWENKFDHECRPADKGADLKKIEVNRWYELLTTKNEREYIRLQSLKKVR